MEKKETTMDNKLILEVKRNEESERLVNCRNSKDFWKINAYEKIRDLIAIAYQMEEDYDMYYNLLFSIGFVETFDIGELVRAGFVVTVVECETGYKITMSKDEVSATFESSKEEGYKKLLTQSNDWAEQMLLQLKGETNDTI